MNMEHAKTFVYQITLISVGLAFALGINYLYAWTGPTGTAPNNNVSSPVDTGATAQVKDGNLSVGRSTNTVANVGFSVIGSSYVDGWLKVGDGVTGVATQPLELVGTAGTHGIKFPDGTTQTTAASGQNLEIRYVTADNVDGTPMTTSFVTMPLNTVSINNITGASLSANSITLPAGSYRIRATFRCTGITSTGSVKVRLWNGTAASLITTATGRANLNLTYFLVPIETIVTVAGNTSFYFDGKTSNATANTVSCAFTDQFVDGYSESHSVVMVEKL